MRAVGATRLAAALGAAAALMGAPVTGTKAPAPPAMVRRANRDDRRRERERRRQRRRGLDTHLECTAPMPLFGTVFKAVDGTKYRQWSDGSLRREPARLRGKANVKLHKRLRQAARHQQRAAAARAAA